MTKWLVINCSGCGRQIAVPECRDWLDRSQWCSGCGGTASKDQRDIARVKSAALA